jgi:crossover junction endodeoxyribonuclease RuvC
LKHHGRNSLKQAGEKTKKIRILGIDPGSIVCGYGLIESNAYTPAYIASGNIALPQKSPLHQRLKSLHDRLIAIIREFKPQEIAVEQVFFAKGAKAALHLGQARGIVLYTAAAEELAFYEYSALEVKKAITGYGRAEKRQVHTMVINILNIKSLSDKIGEDSSDALALAICHLNTIKCREAMSRGTS